MRRRLAILLVPAVATVGAAFGTALSATPAHADELAHVHVTVEKPPVDSLLTLCLTSQTLLPNGTCITIP